MRDEIEPKARQWHKLYMTTPLFEWSGFTKSISSLPYVCGCSVEIWKRLQRLGCCVGSLDRAQLEIP